MPKIEVTQPDGSSDTPPLDEIQAAPPPEDEPPADEPAAESTEAAAPAEPPAAEPEPDEVQVTIGDETPPEDPEQAFSGPAPDWVKELREEQRRLRRQVREYEARERAAQQQGQPVAVPTLGAKPKLEDHDYDTDRYESALEAWYKQKDAADAAKREQEQALAEQQKAWQARLDAYGQQKTALKVRDYDEAEATVQETLNVTQQGVVLQGAENPALVVYALGKNPKRAKELAAITDPVRFAFAVAKLEQQLKITPRAKPPAPERTVPAGTAPVSGATDSALERLRADAERTGDYSKVVRYKQQLRAKQAAAR